MKTTTEKKNQKVLENKLNELKLTGLLNGLKSIGNFIRITTKSYGK